MKWRVGKEWARIGEQRGGSECNALMHRKEFQSRWSLGHGLSGKVIESPRLYTPSLTDSRLPLGYLHRKNFSIKLLLQSESGEYQLIDDHSVNIHQLYFEAAAQCWYFCDETGLARHEPMRLSIHVTLCSREIQLSPGCEWGEMDGITSETA